MNADTNSDNSIGLHKRAKTLLSARSSTRDGVSVEEFRHVLDQLRSYQTELEARDIELRAARYELEHLSRYTEELEAHNNELEAFAHTVAHDLKNPLGVILGYGQMLSDNSKPLSSEDTRFAIAAITQSANKMSEIMDSMLLLAGVNRTEVPIEPCDTASIIAGVWQVLGHMIEDYQATIVMPDTWPLTLGYGPWIEVVWTNYLSNAMKYGGKPPQIELGATVEQDQMVRFWVRDNGPGLTPDEQSRVFVPFTRLAPSRAEGNGVGLSIVQRIVERLGGQVSIESEAGKGSIFSFSLPKAVGQVNDVFFSERPGIEKSAR